MNIKKFDKNKKKKTYIVAGIVFVVFAIVGITIYRSWALYQENKSYNVLAGVIPDFSSGDVVLTFTIDGKSSTEAFPSKDSGYKGNVTCENGVSASWDNESWGLVVSNSNNQSNIVCNVDFSLKPSYNIKATKYITQLLATSDEIVDDETSDHNLRYIGANPSNYVSFNGELWRIIGVMNDVADENGTVEPRIKLIRNETIGEYIWGSSSDWTNSSTMKILNSGDYYNRLGDFSSNGFTEETKEKISNVVWKLGSTNNPENPSGFYTKERGTIVYTGRPTEWIGEVGLMYASDYGYATGGGTTENREDCLNSQLNYWNNTSHSDCKNNNWLLIGGQQWTLTTRVSNPFHIHNVGSVDDVLVDNKINILPVIYLNVNIKITDGIGTSTDPFILQA